MPRRWVAGAVAVVAVVAALQRSDGHYPDSTPPEATRTDASHKRCCGDRRLGPVGKIRRDRSRRRRFDPRSRCSTCRRARTGSRLHETPNCSSPNGFSAGAPWAPPSSGKTPQDLIPMQYGNAEQRRRNRASDQRLARERAERRRRAQRRAVLRRRASRKSGPMFERCHRVRCVRADAPASVLTRPLIVTDRPITMGLLTDRRILITGIAVHALDRLRHGEGVPSRRRHARLHIRERRPARARRQDRCRIRSVSRAPVQRRLRRRDRGAVRFAAQGMERARRLAAFDRIRAARSARRRLSERAVAQRVRRRARHLELQLRRARERCAPADARVATRRC